MKNLFTIIILSILLNLLTTAQENNFKTVYIAKDVIDNFITSMGGKDKVEKIHSIKIEGIINTQGKTLNLIRYIGEDYFYQTMQSSDYCTIISYNDNIQKGWYTSSNKPLDFDKNSPQYYNVNSIFCYTLYLDGYDLGIKYVLVENENIDTSLYCVDFIKDDITISTMYFNKSDFHKVKTVSNGQERIYSDFKTVGGSGIVMPHLIKSDDTLKVINYKFNQHFDKKLLDKSSLKYFNP